MATTGLTFNEGHPLVTKDDPVQSTDPKDGATVWMWRPLPNSVLARISDMQSAQQVSQQDPDKQIFLNRTSQRNRECFRFGVFEVYNWFDRDKNPIPIKNEVILEGTRQFKVLAEEFLDTVPLSIINEVGAEIFRMNSLTDAQRKNFEGLLSQLGNSQISNAAPATPKTKNTVAAKARPSATAKSSTAKTGATKGTGKTPARKSGKAAAPDATS